MLDLLGEATQAEAPIATPETSYLAEVQREAVADVMAIEEKLAWRDPLGWLGDDEALISANLWRRGAQMVLIPIPAISFTDGTQAESQSAKRLASRVDVSHQRREIARVTGWPCRPPAARSLPTVMAAASPAR